MYTVCQQTYWVDWMFLSSKKILYSPEPLQKNNKTKQKPIPDRYICILCTCGTLCSKQNAFIHPSCSLPPQYNDRNDLEHTPTNVQIRNLLKPDDIKDCASLTTSELCCLFSSNSMLHMCSLASIMNEWMNWLLLLLLLLLLLSYDEHVSIDPLHVTSLLAC